MLDSTHWTYYHILEELHVNLLFPISLGYWSAFLIAQLILNYLSSQSEPITKKTYLTKAFRALIQNKCNLLMQN